MAVATGLTIDDFEKLPAALARNHELVDGELVDVSGNTLNHNLLRDYLIRLLAPQSRAGTIVSEQEFNFEGDVYRPGVAFISTERVPLLNPDLRVQTCVPDLAIEVISRNDTFVSMMKKAHRYRKSGTKEVWIFDIENRIAFVLSEQQQAILDENQRFESSLLPGFSIQISQLLDRI